jgi:hypothetical protein
MAKDQADQFIDNVRNKKHTHPNSLLNPTILNFPDGSSNVNIGLTKREYFAAMAMQGISANGISNGKLFETIAEWSVKQADALIEALNK